MTPAAAERLRLYRSAHRIAPVKDYSDEPREGFEWKCEVCHLRVIPRHAFTTPPRAGLWRHHPDDVRALARAERGE